VRLFRRSYMTVVSVAAGSAAEGSVTAGSVTEGSVAAGSVTAGEVSAAGGTVGTAADPDTSPVEGFIAAMVPSGARTPTLTSALMEG